MGIRTLVRTSVHVRKLAGLATFGFALAGCGGTNPALSSTTSNVKVSPAASPTPPYTISHSPPGDLDGIYDPAAPISDGSGTLRYALPKSMAALGDSISAGFLADVRRGGYLYSDQIFRELQLAFDYFENQSNPYPALEKKGWSWATGEGSDGEVKSHAYRLHKLWYDFKSYNAAVTGSEAKDLAPQLTNVLNWSKANLKQGAPDYITLLIGANDICADKIADMTPTATYQSQVTEVVATLLQANPTTRVMISSIPSIEPLRQTARTARAFVGSLYTCEDIWKQVNICPNVTLDANPADRQVIAQRVIDYNSALRKIAADYSRTYGDRVRYGSSVYDYKFTTDDLSIDCFHPNPDAQNMLATRNFNQGWWYNEWKQWQSTYFEKSGGTTAAAVN